MHQWAHCILCLFEGPHLKIFSLALGHTRRTGNVELLMEISSVILLAQSTL